MGARVGAVVDARRVGVRVVEHRHLDRRRRDTDEDREQELAAVPTPHRETDADDERPQQVELLLHRQRPHVLEQRRTADVLEIREMVEDQVPVLHVRERGDHLTAELVDRVGEEQQRVQRHRGQHREQRGEQAAGAAEPESAEIDVAVLAPVGEEQGRDQVAADHEEHVDAEEPPGDPVLVAVVQQDRDHRERAEAVKGRDIAETRESGGGGSVRYYLSGHSTMVAHAEAGEGT